MAEDGKTSILKGAAMVTLFVVAAFFFGLDGNMTKQTSMWLVLIYGLFNLVGGLMASRTHGREVGRLQAAPPLPDVTWYVLNDEGLVVLADGKVDRGPAGLTVPWSAMRTLARIEGEGAAVHLTYRLPKALSPEVLRLPADRKGSDGAQFGDRIKTLFEARSAAAPAPVSLTPQEA